MYRVDMYKVGMYNDTARPARRYTGGEIKLWNFQGTGLTLPGYTVHKVSDLGQEERLLFERWLGRSLSLDETISVNAWRPHSPPSGNGLEAIRCDIVGQAVETGSRAPEMARDEIDALVEEAYAATRGSMAILRLNSRNEKTCCRRMAG